MSNYWQTGYLILIIYCVLSSDLLHCGNIPKRPTLTGSSSHSEHKTKRSCSVDKRPVSTNICTRPSALLPTGVTSQKNEDLIYAVAEARRHPQLHQCKAVAVGVEHRTDLLAHDSSCLAVSVGPRVHACVR
jgi:hypothetical protein